MVLLEINLIRIPIGEFKRKALGAVDVNGKTLRVKTRQSMKIVTGMVHIVGNLDRFKPLEPVQNAFLKPGVDLRSFTCPKRGQLFVAKTLDHADRPV